MKKTKHNKLVRDNIPEIIKMKGDVPKIHIANEGEYLERLGEKLREEIEEFLKEHDPEELADVLEVILAFCWTMGKTPDEIDTIREKKAKERGGFTRGIILEYVISEDRPS
jgi:predicted house-cleaning noncanonical NTP pyrophosphatase (MazG superfamily)